MKRIFAFDMGKASIGYCVREDLDIKEANSIIIDADHGEVATKRSRRRTYRTLFSHKKREENFNKLWIKAGLEILDKNDIKFSKEFASAEDKIIYNSTILRIILLQNKQLKEWQIYKALYNAIQRRGYDSNLPWKTDFTEDDKYNQKLAEKYTKENNNELIINEEYKFPCYYDALRLGLWSEAKPNEFKRSTPKDNYNKIRSTSYVAPREMVIKELVQLWQNAQKQIPNLKNISVEEFLYGDYREQYGSYKNPDLRKFLGTNTDLQGVLGQKIPRFENRIIGKCRLLPKRNVCKANTIENVTLVLLMQLKNLRLTKINGDKVILTPNQINNIYNNWIDKYKEKNKLDATITQKEIEKVLNAKLIDKIPPIKAKITGRSSFCRRGCMIMTKIILDGINPHELDYNEFLDNKDTKNGITKDEIENMLSKLDTWDNLYIPDNKETIIEQDNIRRKTDFLIGSITNSIVKNRLQIFRDLILQLAKKYGKPDEIIFEFPRDDSLYGEKNKAKYLSIQKENEKENEIIKKELNDIQKDCKGNFLKVKLLKMQAGKCIYSGKPIAISDLDSCEIDHIFPRSLGGNDALYNKVLCYKEENQQKMDRIPYDWLYGTDRWIEYLNRINSIKNLLAKCDDSTKNKKFQLLTSPLDTCKELIESYNGLAETGYISRLAQQIASVIFNYELGKKDEQRHIFVNNGSNTYKIRKQFDLNVLLGNANEKNRQNDKHHALDAICISFSRDTKGLQKDNVEKIINEIIPLPYTHKKLLKANITPLETIHGLRTYGNISYITKRIPITNIEQKEAKIKTIIDLKIKEDLLSKINLSKEDWRELIKNYYHPTKKTLVKKVMISVAEGKIEFDKNGRKRIGEFVDFGTKGTKHQFKCSKAHKGQILYYDEKNNIKVMPIYSNIKTQDLKDKLIEMNCNLYLKGQIFTSGCLVRIPNDFKGGKNTYKKGIYKLRTLKTNGVINLENNNGEEISTSAKNLVDVKFYKLNKNFDN